MFMSHRNKDFLNYGNNNLYSSKKPQQFPTTINNLTCEFKKCSFPSCSFNFLFLMMGNSPWTANEYVEGFEIFIKCSKCHIVWVEGGISILFIMYFSDQRWVILIPQIVFYVQATALVWVWWNNLKYVSAVKVCSAYFTGCQHEVLGDILPSTARQRRIPH